ncbi:ATP-binding protein [Pseudomonas sp. 2023EL-01195]|uniref:ATP-binding protein n=1 Tax=Pseudomonas sp. 2023EL-01195 TaxID=3088134 RepID=UPI00296AB371|nr:ATP-binding protein [Pseudomonas sp. 2023EL-01195]MDW3714098.1 ATP-binding protein [Pseudomonas sp. 2023EL-01195]
MADSSFLKAPAKKRGEPMYDSCPEHGQFESWLTEQFDGTWKANSCQQCQWQALNWRHVAEADRSAAREAKRAEIVNQRLIASGITPRFRSCSFDNFDHADDQAKRSALESCRRYAEDFEAVQREGRSQLLLGNLGTGKTHLASAIVQSVIRKYSATAIVTTASEIARAVKATFARSSKISERDVLDELASVDLLVIDEVGVQVSTGDFGPGLLHEVIDRRYQQVLPTILISNVTVEELPRFIGDRALDRLRQGSSRLVRFTWDSVRGEA